MKMTKEVRHASRQLLRMSFTDGKLDRSKVSKIVESLISAQARDFVSILEAYHRLIRLEVAKTHAVIESAVPFEDATGEKIVENLRNKYGADLTAEFKVNPELIGGVRIKIGSDVWDGSVKERLNRLSETI